MTKLSSFKAGDEAKHVPAGPLPLPGGEWQSEAQPQSEGPQHLLHHLHHSLRLPLHLPRGGVLPVQLCRLPPALVCHSHQVRQFQHQHDDDDDDDDDEDEDEDEDDDGDDER